MITQGIRENWNFNKKKDHNDFKATEPLERKTRKQQLKDRYVDFWIAAILTGV